MQLGVSRAPSTSLGFQQDCFVVENVCVLRSACLLFSLANQSVLRQIKQRHRNTTKGALLDSSSFPWREFTLKCGLKVTEGDHVVACVRFLVGIL